MTKRLLILVLILPACSRGPSYNRLSVSELEKQLDSHNFTLQTQTAIGLGNHGPSAKTAIPALLRLLASPEVLLRQQVCIALGKIGSADEAVVDALIATLQDPEWSVRRQAILALATIKPRLDRVDEPLRQAGDTDPSNLVQKAAQETLGQLRQGLTLSDP